MSAQETKPSMVVTHEAVPAAPRSLESAGLAPKDLAPAGIVLARLIGFADGLAVLLLPGQATPVVAAHTGTVSEANVEGQVAVTFLDRDLAKPIVLGPIVQMPSGQVPERLDLMASSELTLKCGPATLRLLADGSAVLRGVNVVTRASATNRIRGGNVQIN